MGPGIGLRTLWQNFSEALIIGCFSNQIYFSWCYFFLPADFCVSFFFRKILRNLDFEDELEVLGTSSLCC